MKLSIKGGSPIRKSFLIFGSPDIQEEDISEVVDTLRSGWISTGPKVQRFEEKFRKYIGAKYALAVNSCTAGLHLSLLVCGIKSGDEVITCPMTFAATANVIHHVNATPVFVDCLRESATIDPEQIEERINGRTKAIMPIHFAGRPADMEPILKIARKHRLAIIEDAAHAIEASYRGRKIGTIGDLTSFSFYVTKNVVTGEGGIITTNNDIFAEKIQQYALHGLTKGAWKRYRDEGFKHYQVVFPGYKYNMMDIQAAIGLHQLGRIEKNLKRREEIWNYYNEQFNGLPLFTPQPPEENTIHARHLYTVLVDLKRVKVSRDTIQQALFHENIGTGIHYISLHLHPYYRKTYGFKENDFPNAKLISERTLSLPFSTKLTDNDVEDVVKAVRKVFLYFAK